MLTVELAQFGQFGDEGGRGDGSNAGSRTDDLGGVLELGVGFKQPLDLDGEPFQLLLIEVDGLLNELSDLWIPGPGQAVLFLDEQVPDLMAARGQSLEFFRIFAEGGGRLRLDSLRKQGDGLGVEPVGLGQAIEGPSEVSDLAWVDDCHGDASAVQFLDEESFEATGSFETDQFDALFDTELSERLDSRRIIGSKALLLLGRWQ